MHWKVNTESLTTDKRSTQNADWDIREKISPWISKIFLSWPSVPVRTLEWDALGLSLSRPNNVLAGTWLGLFPLRGPSMLARAPRPLLQAWKPRWIRERAIFSDVHCSRKVGGAHMIDILKSDWSNYKHHMVRSKWNVNSRRCRLWIPTLFLDRSSFLQVRTASCSRKSTPPRLLLKCLCLMAFVISFL